MRDHAAGPAQLVPAAHVALGRVVHDARRPREEARALAGMLSTRSPASLAKLHSSMPVERLAVEAAERHARAA